MSDGVRDAEYGSLDERREQMVCPIHPTYEGAGPPTKGEVGCICKTIWEHKKDKCPDCDNGMIWVGLGAKDCDKCGGSGEVPECEHKDLIASPEATYCGICGEIIPPFKGPIADVVYLDEIQKVPDQPKYRCKTCGDMIEYDSYCKKCYPDKPKEEDHKKHTNNIAWLLRRSGTDERIIDKVMKELEWDYTPKSEDQSVDTHEKVDKPRDLRAEYKAGHTGSYLSFLEWRLKQEHDMLDEIDRLRAENAELHKMLAGWRRGDYLTKQLKDMEKENEALRARVKDLEKLVTELMADAIVDKSRVKELEDGRQHPIPCDGCKGQTDYEYAQIHCDFCMASENRKG